MRKQRDYGEERRLLPVTRRRVVVGLIGITLLMRSGSVRAADEMAEPARKWVESFINDGLVLLRDRAASTDQQVGRFRQLLHSYFALDAIGRWALGRYWRQATASEQQKYLRLFEDFVVYGYVERFSEYSDETIRIVRAVDNSDGSAMVYSQVERANSNQPVSVNWRVSRDSSGTMRMTDVVIENVSLSQTYRSDFASAMQQQDGSITGLLTVLRQRIDAQKAQLGLGK